MAYDDEEVVDDNLDDSEADYDTTGTTGALSALGTTPEARKVASGVFSSLYKERGNYNKQEKEAFDEYEARAREAREVLARARDTLLAQKRSKQEMFLAAAAGFGAPTKAGSFAESLGAAAGNMLPIAHENHQWEEARNDKVLQYNQGMSGIDQQLATNRLKLLQSRRAADAKLMDSALKVMARPDASSRWKPLGPQSKYAKMAFDEGLQPDTPQYTARINQLYQQDMDMQRQRAGTDVSDELAPADREALSTRFGAPIVPSDPYAGLSTKARQAARQRAAIDARKQLEEMGNQANGMVFSDNTIDRFLELNKNTPSGRILGMNPLGGSDAEEMDAITADLARKQRQIGEGSVSNFDASQFLKATLSRTKKYEANVNMAKAIKARNRLVQDRIKFFNDYAAVNDNTLTGAQQAWQMYLESNPIFDPKHPGTYMLNPAHQDYRTWFNAQKTQQGFAEGGAVKKKEIPKDAGAVHAALQGLSMGTSDELADLFYNGGTDDERATLEQFGDESPVSAGASEIAGAMVPTGVTMAALSRIRARATGKGGKTAKIASLALRMLPKSKLGKAIGTGAGGGALAGLTSQGDMDQRLTNARSGALFGSFLGPTMAYGGEGALKVGRKVFDKLTQEGNSAAVMKYLQALKRDALTPKDVTAQVTADARMGVPSTVADVGGPEVNALTQHVMSKDAPGAQQLVDQTTQLQGQARDRAEALVNKHMKPDPYFAQEQKLVDQMRTQADPLYKAAYAAPPIPLKNTVIMQILNTPAGRAALRKTMVTLKNRVPPLPLGKSDATGMMTHMSTEAIDEVKKNFGAMERMAKQKGDGHSASLYGDLRRMLVDEADKVNPLYAKARAQFGDDAEVLDALHFGRDEALKLEPEQIAAQVQNMSFSARDAMRTGVARTLMEEIREPARAKNFAEFINSPAVRDRIAAVFDTPQQAAIFTSALAREAALSGARGQALRGASQRASARAHAALEGNGGAQTLGAAGEIAGLGNAAMGELSGLGILARTLGFLRSRVPMSQGTANEVSRILATGGPREVRALMTQMDQQAQLMEARAAQGEDFHTLLSGAEGEQIGSPDPQGYVDQQQQQDPDQEMPQ